MHNFLEPAKVAPCISTWASGSGIRLSCFSSGSRPGMLGSVGETWGGAQEGGGSGKATKAGFPQWTLGQRTDGGTLENFSTCLSLPSSKSQFSSQLVLVNAVPVTQWSSKSDHELRIC